MKYKSQVKHMVSNLEKEIAMLKLADEICRARYERGIDRIPCDIHIVLEKMKELSHFDDASIYYLMMREEI